MITFACGCNKQRKIPETTIGKRFRCPSCDQSIQIISAEPLADGAGVGDFDSQLAVIAGPVLQNSRFILGGVVNIDIGRTPEQHIALAGTNVSRAHCKLARIDFGPSRWKIIDNNSANGIYINGSRVTEQELQDGDEILIGDFELKFSQLAEVIEALPVPVVSPKKMTRAEHAAMPVVGGVPCPSCEKPLSSAAKICIDCGININTGRPVLTAQDVDENLLYENARQFIRWISLLVWVTPMPIPIRSEAFGTRKPYAIWTIAAATILASITFFIAQSSDGSGFNRPGKDLMLWQPNHHAEAAVTISPQKIRTLAKKLTDEERDELRDSVDDPDHKLSDEQLLSRALADAIRLKLGQPGEFHWYQLLTHAFLHDTSSLYNFTMHLAGNMVFLLVFGTRVNALIGNLATAILYPILAVCAATAHLMSLGDSFAGPMLGASGAIMGLAGMYLILFPVHRVYCAMWISIWLRFRRIFGCKIFTLRGFWILLIYFGYDILMNFISSHFGLTGGVAHWAHIGGFCTGFVLAFTILFSRQFNTLGSDVLSVTLGKKAWPLIGKPSRWIKVEPVYPRAISLNM